MSNLLFRTLIGGVILGGSCIAVAAAADDASQELFTKLDRDGDGVLTREEVGDENARMLQRLVRRGDKNQDGKLGRDEFLAAVKETAEQNDPNNPPRPDARPDQNPDRRPPPQQIIRQFDKDGDGKLSKDEVPERMRENMERIDTDRDGFVTVEELQSAFRAMARSRNEAGTPTERPGTPTERPSTPTERPSTPTPGREQLGNDPAAERPNAGAPDRPAPNAANPEQETRAIESMFDNRDENRDGKLTADEMPEANRAMFERLRARFGTEGESSLTREQFVKAMRELRRSGQGNAGAPRPNQAAPNFLIFRALDTDRDGKLSAEEIDKAAEALRQFDANKDGSVTRDELEANRPRQ
ncbi:MAG: hypothetical protein RIS70_1254 [Planctomycetota bacterium]